MKMSFAFYLRPIAGEKSGTALERRGSLFIFSTNSTVNSLKSKNYSQPFRYQYSIRIGSIIKIFSREPTEDLRKSNERILIRSNAF
jgi:hypothetical protein